MLQPKPDERKQTFIQFDKRHMNHDTYRYSHNMQFQSTTTDPTDPQALMFFNTWRLHHNLYTKYLVWYMSNISIRDDVNRCQQIDRSHLSVKTKLVTNPNLLVF